MTTATRSHCRSCGLPFGIVEPHEDAPNNCQDCVEKCQSIGRRWEHRVIECEDCHLPIRITDAIQVPSNMRSLYPRRICQACRRSPRYHYLDKEDDEE